MTTTELWDAIGAALLPLADEIDGLQVQGRGQMTNHPTPPTVDVYPGNPFQVGAGFGIGEIQTFWTVRARVGTLDDDAGQRLLMRMQDPRDPASVEAALDGVAVAVEVSGWQAYPGGEGPDLLGAEWRVTEFL